MPIKTDFIDLELERCADGGATRDPVGGQSMSPDAGASCPRHEGRRADRASRGRSFVRCSSRDCRGRVYRVHATANRPPSGRFTGRDRARARGRSRRIPVRPGFNDPEPQPIRMPETPATPPLPAGRWLPDQPDDPALPLGLDDRRFPRRGWEQDYGVPHYLVGAADVLYYHRRQIAEPDMAVIDAALLRLYQPWIRQDAAWSPGVDGGDE